MNWHCHSCVLSACCYFLQFFCCLSFQFFFLCSACVFVFIREFLIAGVFIFGIIFWFFRYICFSVIYYWVDGNVVVLFSVISTLFESKCTTESTATTYQHGFNNLVKTNFLYLKWWTCSFFRDTFFDDISPKGSYSQRYQYHCKILSKQYSLHKSIFEYIVWSFNKKDAIIFQLVDLYSFANYTMNLIKTHFMKYLFCKTI